MVDPKRIAIGTKDVKMEFEVAQPYDEGHVCTAAEAKALNQTRRENIANNFRTRVQATLSGEEGAMSEAELRKAFSDYERDYVITEAAVGTGAGTMTPLEKESRKVARDIAKAQLSASGRSVYTEKTKGEFDPAKHVSKDDFDSEIARLAELDKVQKIAAKSLKDREQLASQLLEAVA